MNSQQADIVVVGGSAAGLTAAITAHRHYPGRKVLLIRKEEKVPIPCGIPYIYGTVGSPEKNLIPDAALEKNQIELLLGEVTGVVPADRKVLLADGRSVTYERLILATGSKPAIPPIKGSEMEGVWAVYKDVPYLTRLQERLSDVRNLVIIGGGFIGVEFADECKKAGVEQVTVVEMLPHCLMLSYDPECAAKTEEVLRERGVALSTNVRVQELIGNGKVEAVRLASGDDLPADAVIMGIGAVADVSVADAAGLRLGATGGIQVDRNMQTSDPNIFACGDCAEKLSFFGGGSSPLKLASIATSEARIAGANLFGNKRENIGTIGVWSTAIGDFALAGAGLTETMAKRLGYDYVTGVAEGPNRHPGCMPDAGNVKVKLLFERRTGVLLGAQMSGDKVVGEMINIISPCIQKRMTFDDIATFQIGTHPALTSSPIAYQIVNAAEMAEMTVAN